MRLNVWERGLRAWLERWDLGNSSGLGLGRLACGEEEKEGDYRVGFWAPLREIGAGAEWLVLD